MGATKTRPRRTLCRNFCGDRIELTNDPRPGEPEIWLHVTSRARMCNKVAAPAVAEACSHGCPADAQTAAGGVLMTGHTDDCPAEPRQYVWLHSGLMETGTLAQYGRAYEFEHCGLGEPGSLGTELRTWQASYEVTVEPGDEPPSDDGCVLVRLSVPGEEVFVRAWANGPVG
jgi:hypothetical protein